MMVDSVFFSHFNRVNKCNEILIFFSFQKFFGNLFFYVKNFLVIAFAANDAAADIYGSEANFSHTSAVRVCASMNDCPITSEVNLTFVLE